MSSRIRKYEVITSFVSTETMVGAPMTKLLNEAFQKASSLSEDLQDQLAQRLLEEMQWEAAWDDSLDRSQDELDALADKALKEFQDGNTADMGFDEL